MMTSTSRTAHDAEQQMLGAVPATAALGRGPKPGDERSHEYHHPAPVG
jgi:hypothetical protein